MICDTWHGAGWLPARAAELDNPTGRARVLPERHIGRASMRRRDPEPRLYMHDTRLGNGAIVSQACLGAECPVCAGDPEAARRADNQWFAPPRRQDTEAK